jgi:hypothetical protein
MHLMRAKFFYVPTKRDRLWQIFHLDYLAKVPECPQKARDQYLEYLALPPKY